MSLCNQLEDNHYITRSNLARLNQTAIHLQALAQEKLVAGCQIEHELSEQVLENVTPKERQQFVALLKKLTLLMSGEGRLADF